MKRFLSRSPRSAAAATMAVACLVVFSDAAAAQARPSPAQAQQALQNPEIIARIQREIQNSGMTREQVRARLRAEGYPESLLDQVMPGFQGDSAALTPDVFDAVKALGILDSAGVRTLDSARALTVRTERIRARLDSAFLDSLAIFLQADDSAQAAVRRLLRSRDMQRAFADSGFQVFGRDMFERATTQFDRDLSGPVDDQYRLGAGDRLVLTLTGDVDAAFQLEVNREGFVVIPNVGSPLHVANLTKADAERLIRGALSRVHSGLRQDGRGSMRMLLSVASLGARQVIVTGDVATPGAVRVPNSGTMFTALYQAGGPTESGSMRRVELRRGARLVGTLDVYDYLVHGSTANDLRLESGDVIFVPPRGGQVRITGAVLRPATYELKPGETLDEAIRMAGGFRPAADRRRVQIERYMPAEQRGEAGRDRRVFDIVSPGLANGELPRVGLEPGDVLRIMSVPARLTGHVTVKGNVWHAGPVAFAPGMLLSEALSLAGGVKSDSYLEQVNISRLQPDSTRTMLRAALRDTAGNVRADLELREFDEIEVFSRTDFRPQRYVSVTGAVRRPGRVPFRDGMTMRDLVLEAGGLQESALLREAEIARLPEDRSRGVSAVTLRVPLDSTYLFERGPGGRYFGPPGIQVASGTAPEVVLQPYDNVTIMHQPNWSLTQTVSVQGEVRYPTVYAITRQDERIADVIRRAGGLTDQAYANGVVFIRKRGGVGRVGVDLPRVLRDPSHVDNLPVVDGDSIFIPKYVGIVTVRGAVNAPVGVAYVPGKRLDYYVRAAGGGTSKADEGKAFVTQPNGKVESRDRRLVVWQAVPRPQPGSTVEVPERDVSERRDYSSAITAAVSIVGSLATIYALLRPRQ